MIVKFNSDTGLMYIHFTSGVANIQTRTDNEQISKFVAKANREHVVGYEIENADQNLSQVLTTFPLSRKQKLAVALCYTREKQKKTQKEFSTIINVSESTYKSIERAEHNITFDTLDVIYNQFPEERSLHQIF
jgi:DNA-directed RNA polymerase specialized sigma subunit